jgi:hypothetical protein
MSNSIAFQTLSSDQLADTTGGLGWGTALRFAGKKVLGPVGAAIGGYQATNTFLDDRAQHRSVGSSLWHGIRKGFLI